jgi:hypothetical protein
MCTIEAWREVAHRWIEWGIHSLSPVSLQDFPSWKKRNIFSNLSNKRERQCATRNSFKKMNFPLA